MLHHLIRIKKNYRIYKNRTHNAKLSQCVLDKI